MEKELSEKLQLYYGSLIQQYHSSFEWYEKKKILEKIRAIEILLEIPFVS